jgi:hypothetical protein
VPRSMNGNQEEQGTERENKFPFGVPGEEDNNPASVGVSYATAEGEISREGEDSRRKSTVFSEREAIIVKVTPKRGKLSKPKVIEPAHVRGILKSITSPLFFWC